MAKFGDLKIELIFPDKVYVTGLGEVKTTATVSGREIEPEGLYSTEIFGPIGSDERMSRFGYIDLHLPLLHPRIFLYLATLSSFYHGIMSSSKHAIFNPKTKEFEPADSDTGKTGYSFFMKHLYEMKLPEKDSDKAKNMVETIEKYRKRGVLTNTKLLVLPAGMRDINIEDTGRITEDELNDFYKPVISSSRILEGYTTHDPYVDYLAYDLQYKIHLLYSYIFNMMKGKKGYIGKNVSRRSVDYSSRNVLSGKAYIVEDLLKEDKDLLNTSIMGIFQFIKSTEPLSKHAVLEQFTNSRFNSVTGKGKLYDPKKKKFVELELLSKQIDEWVGSDGLTNLFNKALDNGVKQTVMDVDGYWLYPVLDTGDTITIIPDNDGLMEVDTSKLRGLTLGEMLYLSAQIVVNDIATTMTRFPITGQGSIYGSGISLSSTVLYREAEVTYPNGMKVKYKNYPKQDSIYDESVSASYGRWKGLSSDADGDTLASHILMSEEAVKEVRDEMNSLKSIIGPDGKFTVELADYIADTVIKTLSK